MNKDRKFISSLLKEMKEWVSDGLITSDQEKNITMRYSPYSGTPAKMTGETVSEKKELINIARVVTGLATLSLAIGIIIFYASNWRYMPPALKIAQIFILMLAIYGSAFFFLDPKRNHPAIGSALLILGIVSYGTGIMLVAQIYHISSHPTNGILAWGAGALIVSAAAREKYGYYLSALLFFIWNMWEITVFGSAGYMFIIPVIIIALLLIEYGDKTGITGSAILVCWYIFQCCFYWIFTYGKNGYAWYLLVVVFVLAGAGLFAASKLLVPHDELQGAGNVFRVSGWGAWFMPLILFIYAAPDTGYPVFLWGSAVLAASFLLKKHEGYYVSVAIFFFWSWTEISSRGNLPWLYIIPAAITGFLFYRRSDRTGFALTALSAIWYFIFFTWHFINKTPLNGAESSAFFAFMTVPAGAALVLSGRILRNYTVLSEGGIIIHATGWLFFLVPFFLNSWPLNISGIKALILFHTPAALSIEYLAITGITAVLLYLTGRRNEPLTIPAMLFIFSLAGFALPMGHTATRMVSLHIGIIVILVAMLYISYHRSEYYTLERGIAVTFILSMIIIKGIGFISYAEIDSRFRLAYLAGYILFVTVCFLVNRLVNNYIDNRLYPQNIIDAFCALAVWVSVYLSSFETRNQSSIFSADRVAVIMIILFVIMAAILYSVLIPRLRNGRIMLWLSVAVLACSGITILIAGPSVPWELYSAIFNLLLITISATYIYYSTVIQSKVLLNAAVIGFVLHIITRYFDLFWDMFSGALLFIITGFIGLFGGYMLERKRKDLSMMIEKSSTPGQEVL